MSQEITVSRIGHALHIRLDRADKRNAVTRSMYEAMVAAVAEAETDETISAILFSGAGDGFCAGNDLNEFLADPPTATDSPAFRFLRAISTAKKVLVAAVHGAAVGIGATMLLHCDLVVAARSAKLSLPFVTLGLVPEAASTFLLPRTIGHQRAAELLLLGQSIDAETALRWGLVNSVVDDATLIDVAIETVTRICSLPPAAVRLSKQLLKDDGADVAARIEQEAGIFMDRDRAFNSKLSSSTWPTGITAPLAQRLVKSGLGVPGQCRVGFGENEDVAERWLDRCQQQPVITPR